MIFEFSFGIGGKLGSTIENAIFRSADRKEELNKIRHDIDVARLRNELKLVQQDRTVTRAAVAANASGTYRWLDAMNATSKGSVVSMALVSYYKGRDNIPSMYVGLPVEDTVRLFIVNESEDGEADGVIRLFNDLKIVN